MFRETVQGAGGFIEDENRRPGVERTGDADSLPLSPTQPDTALAHPVLESIGQTEEERVELGELAPESLHLVIGNPLIMKEMVKHVPDAGSYAPLTILIDERPDGVHISYDEMASFLEPYGSPEALQVAKDLDAKVESLLVGAAG